MGSRVSRSRPSQDFTIYLNDCEQSGPAAAVSVLAILNIVPPLGPPPQTRHRMREAKALHINIVLAR